MHHEISGIRINNDSLFKSLRWEKAIASDKAFEQSFLELNVSKDGNNLNPMLVGEVDTRLYVKNKTLKENLFLWNSLYKNTQIVKKPIISLTAQDFSIFFRIMTKDGNMTSKRFNDGKSVLNSIN